MISSAVEWLETDGKGGFAQGLSSGIRERRYHAFLTTAANPPVNRMVLVNDVEAYLGMPGGFYALTSHKYAPGITHPDGVWRIDTFELAPWPTWYFRVEGRAAVKFELFMAREMSAVFLCWSVIEGASLGLTLTVRPLISGRAAHSLHHRNSALDPASKRVGEVLCWKPYEGVPLISAIADAEFKEAPEWYYSFAYDEERARGYEFHEDLFSPGVFRWPAFRDRALLVFAADDSLFDRWKPAQPIRDFFAANEESERRRRSAFSTALHRSADCYLVRGARRASIIAGYPWFADWGRDTFVSLRGLCLALGRLEEARDILLSWADELSHGMLPNCFGDDGKPQYNSVDASLWFVIAVDDFLRQSERLGGVQFIDARSRLLETIDEILSAYQAGTRFGICCDSDGLLACGEPGQAVTWMDAKVGERHVTPRIGKPVEVQALWLNSLVVAIRRLNKWKTLADKGTKSFCRRFWNQRQGFLYDVIDVDHQSGIMDDSCRPNQIFAVGGLPVCLLSDKRARAVVSVVEQRLLTPYGLRTLAPGEPGYAPHYQGPGQDRDWAYHNGTVWPWLLGPFVEAWVRVREGTEQAKREAYERFLTPLFVHANDAGAGHVSEIFDAEPPHTPRGCPFQAWSLAEVLRLQLQVLAPGIDPST